MSKEKAPVYPEPPVIPSGSKELNGLVTLAMRGCLFEANRLPAQDDNAMQAWEFSTDTGFVRCHFRLHSPKFPDMTLELGTNIETDSNYALSSVKKVILENHAWRWWKPYYTARVAPVRFIHGNSDISSGQPKAIMPRWDRLDTVGKFEHRAKRSELIAFGDMVSSIYETTFTRALFERMRDSLELGINQAGEMIKLDQL